MSWMAEAVKNSGWVLAGRCLERLIRIAVVVVLARVLGVRGFGVYSFAFAFAEMFAIFTDAGLHTVLVREIAKNRDEAPRLLGSALVLKGFMALASWAAMWVMVVWMIPAGESRTSALVASFLLFVSFRVTSLRTLLDAPFEAGLRMARPIILGIGSEFLSAVGLIAAAWAGWPIPGLIAVQLVLFVPGCAVLARLFFREVRPDLRFDPRHWFGLLRMAVPIGAANAFFIVYTRTDFLMLEWISGERSVGMYSAAYKLTGSLGIIPLAVTTSLLPLISRSFEAGKGDEVRKMYRASMSLAMAVGLPLAVCGILFPGAIIGLIYGPEFAPAANALQVLAGSMLLSFLLFVMTTAGVAVGKAGLFAAYAGLLAILNAALNAALIPRFGYVGASWATFVAEATMLAVGLMVLRPVVGLPSGGTALRAAGAAAAAAAGLIWIPMPMAFNLFISWVMYATLIFLGRGITPEGLAAVKSLLGSRFRQPKGVEE